MGPGFRRDDDKGGGVPPSTVIPAEAGIQTRGSSLKPRRQRVWIPAFAGMTKGGGRRRPFANHSVRMIPEKSVPPFPAATNASYKAVACAPSGVAAPAPSAACIANRRSLSISAAANPP